MLSLIKKLFKFIDKSRFPGIGISDNVKMFGIPIMVVFNCFWFNIFNILHKRFYPLPCDTWDQKNFTQKNR